MNRRDALKGLGLSLGYVVATPAVLSILQSCKNEPVAASWTPSFFTSEEGVALKNMVDLIIPKTDDMVGAVDLNVHKFIDAYAEKVASKEEQKGYKKGMAAVLKSLGKSPLEATMEDYDALLAKYLKADTSAKEGFMGDEDETAALQMLQGLRSSTIWAFKTSEEIGKNVLAYDPVPSVYNGCIPLEEATGGKVWSL